MIHLRSSSKVDLLFRSRKIVYSILKFMVQLESESRQTIDGRASWTILSKDLGTGRHGASRWAVQLWP